MEVTQLSLYEAFSALRNKKISSKELTEECLKKQKQTANLGAFLAENETFALQSAEKADQRLFHGQAQDLTGIPISVKDNFCTVDFPTTCASKFLEGYVPTEDAFVVRLLKEQTAVITGKTNMDECAMGSTTASGAYGPAHNPLNIDCVPGGSSGGSAASVASGSSFASIGSDTGGSIRQPAAFCGITGLKPSYGRLSRRGMFPFALSLDQPGFFGRSVKDIALLCANLCKKDVNDPIYSNMPDIVFENCVRKEKKTYKIGYLKQSFDDRVENDIRKNFEEQIRYFESLGHTVVEVDLKFAEQISGLYNVISCAEAVDSLAQFDGVHLGNPTKSLNGCDDVVTASRTVGFGKNVKKRLCFGNYVLSGENREKYYEQALRIRYSLTEFLNRVLSETDFIINPSTATTATKLVGDTRPESSIDFSDVFVIPENLVGLPGISLPCGRDSNGMPMGLHVTCRKNAEEALLTFANAFEENRGGEWITRL